MSPAGLGVRGRHPSAKCLHALTEISPSLGRSPSGAVTVLRGPLAWVPRVTWQSREAQSGAETLPWFFPCPGQLGSRHMAGRAAWQVGLSALPWQWKPAALGALAWSAAGVAPLLKRAGMSPAPFPGCCTGKCGPQGAPLFLVIVL